MSGKKNILLTFLFIFFAAVAVMPHFIHAQDVAKYIPDAETAESGMTLWQIIRAGGEIMLVLALLSIAGLSLIIYYFLTIKPDRMIPLDFLDRTLKLLEDKKFEDAKKTCEDNSNLLSDILLAGLARLGREKVIIKEAMQDEGRRNVDDLWQKLSYLADVAVISPMVGLLGTVLGMIQAFNVIAFQTGAVKPILLAGGISKAMVTTATGLIIAIPCMIFHAYFRGKVQNLSSRLENISTDMFHLIT